MEHNNDKTSQFYVVHFLQEPFKGIDYYVCVPYTWVIIHRFTENVVVVTYPKDEDRFATRERVKKKEKHDINWAFCTAELKYQSDSYDDAELWISKNNNNQPSVRKYSNTNGPTVPWDHELRSSNEKYLSKTKDKSKRMQPYKISKQESQKHMNKESIIEAKRQLYIKRLNWINETTKSTTQNADPQSVSSTEQSTTSRDEQPIGSAQAEETAAATDGVKSTEGSSHSIEQVDNEEEPSMIIDVDALNDVINIEDQSQQEQPKENNGSQNQLASNLPATPKTPSPIEQTPQPSQHNNQSIRVKDVRTLIGPSNNQEPRVDDTSNTRQITSQLTQSSLSPELCNQIENVRKNMAIAAQNSLNRIDPTQPLPKPVTQPLPANNQNLAHQGSSVLIANNINCAPVPGITTSSQGIQHSSGVNTVLAADPRVVYSVASVRAPQNLPLHQNPIYVYQGVQQNLPAPQEHMQMPGQGLLQRPTTQMLDPRLYMGGYQPISEVPQYQPIRPAFNNNPLNVSSQFHQPLEMQHQAQRAVNQRDIQRSQAPVYVPILPKNSRRSPTLQGVRKKTPPPSSSRVPSSIHQAILTALEKYPLNEQELQAILKRIPKEQINPGLTNVLRNIAVLQAHYPHRSNMPVSSSSQSTRMESSSAHQNANQIPRSQAQQVDQSNEVNTTTKQAHFQDAGVRSAPKQTRVVDSRYQTNVSMQEPLSPPYSAASDSGIETDHEAFSYEMSVDEAHEAANQTEHNSVDRSTAQNSLSKLVLQQQMVEKFATVCSQVSSTLHNTVNMFDNLRNSLLETAKSYQTFLDSERIITSENSASHALSSSNVTQEVPPVVEGQNSAPVRRNSSDGNQQSNVVSKVPERTHQKDPKEQPHSTQQFVLPPEYDPNDSKWTLKYRNHMPGLVELIPNSNIYVKYSELKRCEQVSNSCQSLAKMLLYEVFNEKALGVCASMTEVVKIHYQTSPDARPPLDNHGSLILLNYVIQYGFKFNWSADVVKILNTLDHEVKKMRFKNSVKSRF